MNKMEQGELLSAMADGEVGGDALARALQSMQADPDLLRTWEAYHLVGDVLRSSDLAGEASSAAFLARLRPALAGERVDLAVPASAANDLARARPAAANDSRWKILAGVASLAAVLAVGWNLVGLGSGTAQQPQLASAPGQVAPVLVSGEPTVMLRDARLDELLAAHRQFGSATAIPMPAGALRNATFEAPAR